MLLAGTALEFWKTPACGFFHPTTSMTGSSSCPVILRAVPGRLSSHGGSFPTGNWVSLGWGGGFRCKSMGYQEYDQWAHAKHDQRVPVHQVGKAFLGWSFEILLHSHRSHIPNIALIKVACSGVVGGMVLHPFSASFLLNEKESSINKQDTPDQSMLELSVIIVLIWVMFLDWKVYSHGC